MNDHDWLRRAISLAQQAPPSPTAFSVGAILVQGDEVVGEGYSRAEQDHDHAEEVALRHAGRLARGATIYSSMEPCGYRASRPSPCARLLIDAGVSRVVYAAAEPTVFVSRPSGAQQLRDAGIEVTVVGELSDAALGEANEHLPPH
ncbi:deaminase [Haloglycomyces albus]|uniref:deaminase n=1 Tax=Haloglycomyces albus TaxID=526067 RepID=UPI00046D5F71|nr:deaminase [Haloglycomyces albus]